MHICICLGISESKNNQKITDFIGIMMSLDDLFSILLKEDNMTKFVILILCLTTVVAVRSLRNVAIELAKRRR